MKTPDVRPVLLHAAAIGLFFALLAVAGWPPARFQSTPWWWPFWVVNAGFFGGFLMITALSRRPDAAAAIQAEGRRVDLERNRELVIDQLRQLDAEAHKLHPSDLAREREQLLAVGAEASRALAAPAPPVTPEIDVPPNEPLHDTLKRLRDADPAGFDAALNQIGAGRDPTAMWRGVGGTVLFAALIGGLWWIAASDTRERAEGMPITGGDSVRGGDAQAPAAPRGDPRVQALQQRIAANPADLGAHNELTELALGRQDMQLALQTNLAALEINADDADAQTFQAVLRAFIGRRDEAIATLKGLLEANPNLLRANVYLGLLTMESDPGTAVLALERALAQGDDPQLRQALRDARTRLSGQDPATATDAPSESARGAQSLVTGTINAPDAPAPAGAILFVSLRNPAGGPPFAAVRLPPGPFPMHFAITTDNLISMGGAPSIPSDFKLVARLDADGDPMTQPASDPSATVEGLAPGAEGLKIELSTSP